jgi:hypothetical protein
VGTGTNLSGFLTNQDQAQLAAPIHLSSSDVEKKPAERGSLIFDKVKDVFG